MLDAIAEAVEAKVRRSDREAARIQWAAFASSGVRTKEGDPFTVEDFATMPPTPEELAAREARRVAAEKAAEAQFLSQTVAWVEARRRKEKPHTQEGDSN